MLFSSVAIDFKLIRPFAPDCSVPTKPQQHRIGGTVIVLSLEQHRYCSSKTEQSHHVQQPWHRRNKGPILFMGILYRVTAKRQSVERAAGDRDNSVGKAFCRGNRIR
jgi:hypothetical protein